MGCLRKAVFFVVLVLLVAFVAGFPGSAGVSFAEGESGGQVPPPSASGMDPGSDGMGTGWLLLGYIITVSGLI